MFKKNTILKIFLPIILFSIVSFWACENSIKPEETKVSLDGTIIDSQNLPVPFAIVSIFDISSKTSLLTEKLLTSDTTDEDGKYSLSGIPESMSNLVMKVNHPKYPEFASGLADLKTKITSDKKLPIKMDNNKDCNASMNFVITDKLTNATIKEAQIRVSQNGTLFKKAYTDANGKLNLSNVCEGTYAIRVAKDGFAVVEKNVTVVKGDSLAINIPMLNNSNNPSDTCCGGSVGITVNDQNDKAFAGVNVKITLGDKLLVSKLSGDLGKATFDKLCEGKYFITLSKDGYLDKKSDFTLGCNTKIDNIVYKMELKPKDSTKCCTGKITINLKDSAGNILNSKVVLKGKDGIMTKDGSITFDGLCDGETFTFNVLENDGYYAISSFEVVAHCDTTVTVNKTMMKKPVKCCNATLTINLQDSTGKKLNGKVKLMKGSAVLRELKATVEGTVSFDGLCEGDTVRVVASIEGYDNREFNLVIKCDDKLTQTLTYASKPCCDGKLIVTLKDSLNNDLKANYRLTKDGSTFVKEGKIEGPNQAIIGLCEGTYKITFTSENTVTKTIELVITCATPNVQIVPLVLNGKCCDGILIISPKDSTTMQDLNGAIITLYKGGVLIGKKIVENGNVTYEKLCEGEYSFSFDLPGYKHTELKILVTCAKPNEFPLYLNKSTCCDNKLTVNVKDLEGNLLNDVAVDLALNDKVVKSGTTSNGTVNFTDLCEGTYVVRLKKQGYKDSIAVVTIVCGKAGEVLGKMRKEVCCTARATFVPKDSLGNVLNGATVKIYQGSVLVTTLTVTAGKALIENLCEGEYSYSISKDGYKGIEGKFTAKCDTPFATDPVLSSNAKCCNGVLKIFTQDDSTKAQITGATVNLYLNGTLVATKLTVPGAEFTGLCDGTTYTYSITKNGYTGVEDKVSISCNDKKEITKSLKFVECCNAAMKFTVKDDTTQTVLANAKVEVMLDGKVLKSGLTNGDGVYSTDGMCRRNYSIRITRDGYNTYETTWNITECISYQEIFKIKHK